MAGRVDIHPDKFAKLVENKGSELIHHHAILCPCLNPDTGQPDPNCSFCEMGWQYYGAAPIKGVCSGITAEKQFAENGALTLGTMQLTTHADVELGYHDRIENVNSVVNFSELILRSADANAHTRYGIVGVNRLVDSTNRVFVAGVDFSFSGKTITWLTTPPAVGAYFAIAYQVHPLWLVLSHLHIVRDTRVKFRHRVDTHYRLPIQVLCKLEWLCE